MEDLAQPFGLAPANESEVAAPLPSSEAPSLHSPALPLIDSSAMNEVQQQENEQGAVSLEAHSESECGTGGDDSGDASLPVHPVSQPPMASLEGEAETTEGGTGAGVGSQPFCTDGRAAQAAQRAYVEDAEEVGGDAGLRASCAPELSTSGGVGEEAAVESESTGSAAPRAADANGCSTLPEPADAGGAESDGKESNDSVCNECGGGGEVVCCDGCVKSYHTDCLPVAARPRLRANADDWFCPDCASSPAAPSSAAAPPPLAAAKGPQNGSRQDTAPASPSPSYPPAAPANSWTPLPSCVPTRRRKSKATEDYETRINVGPNHQVPHLPDFFLARADADCLSTLAEHSLADGAQSQALGPLLVYSPYLLERSKQQCLADRAAKSCITSQKDLAEFLIKCSKRWKVRPGWQPFSPEFAYKLLHRANYDPERALRMMDDSAFCFQSICDPPLRKYENKWKRRDKRGTFPSSPYPPPVVVRGYLNEKQRQLRMGR
ncbi:hypothetical protein ACSSS7_005471 [Eimeria intestinalis]